MNYSTNNSNGNIRIPSEIVKDKLVALNGRATIRLLQGESCVICLNQTGTGFLSDKLNNYKINYEFSVFDTIMELLLQKGGEAKKGAGRGRADKVGFGLCGLDTVVGYIAHEYSHIALGQPTYDPVFVLSAILEWAGIAKNCRGYIQLVQN